MTLRMHPLPLFATILLAGSLLACAPTPAHKDPRRDALAPLRDRFDAADTDGDGALSRDETAQGMPELAASFDTIDTDRNERVSAAEASSYLEWQRILRRSKRDARIERDGLR